MPNNNAYPKRNAFITRPIPAAVIPQNADVLPDTIKTKRVDDLTADELMQIIDYGTNFTGTELNPKRVADYNEIAVLAAQVKNQCEQ